MTHVHVRTATAWALLGLAGICASASAGDGADGTTAKLTLVPKGGSAKVGYYQPQKATFDTTRPDGVKKVPADAAAPRYGTLPIGDGVLFLLDESEGKPARLWVDTNRNGDFTDDPAAEWTARTVEANGASRTSWNGSAMVELASGSGAPVQVGILAYRFDPNDPSRAAMKNVILFYRDWVREGELTIGGRTMKALLVDDRAAGDFRPKAAAAGDAGKAASGVNLLLDVNGNGRFDRRGESFDVAAPFNVGGTTWEIRDVARDGGSFLVARSSASVPEIPTPPDLSKGKPMLPFTAKDTDGKAVSFPADYKGKVVLVDFWATWCGPCMGEMPNVVKAYERFHDKGFEVLGISLDNEKSIERMPEVMKKAGMTWRQVADGKGWKAEVAQLYAVDSIPATFLVDGTTGRILGADLRGEALATAVEKALSEQSKGGAASGASGGK